MKSANEILALINQASGTTAYHRYTVLPNFPVITDGVMAVADAAGCYWLLDIIGSHQGDSRLDPAFQVWKLAVNKVDGSAVVSGYNDARLIVRQKISYTDFPLDAMELFMMNGVILLPNEY